MKENDVKPADDVTTLSQTQIDEMIERASERGARKALIEMGLINDDAANDFRTLRGFSKTIKTMQHTFVQTIVRWLTIGMLVFIFAGAMGKLDSLVHINKQ